MAISLTDVETAIAEVIEFGQSVSSEHSELRRASLKELYEIQKGLQAEETGTSTTPSFFSRMFVGIPRRYNS